MTATPMTSLYERWVKAGPPPFGVSLSRWWDARLVELHDAIRHLPDDSDATEAEINHALAFGEPVEVVVPPVTNPQPAPDAASISSPTPITPRSPC